MTSLDVCITIFPGRRRDWVEQCVNSVTTAAAVPRLPVHVWIGKALPIGHIGRARYRGYAQGTADYLTYVDDDDYVLPTAFDCLTAALMQWPDAVFTRELQLHGRKRVAHNSRHHLAVYRRDVLADFDFEAWRCFDNIALRRLAERHPDGVRDVPERVYVNRVYPTSRSRALRAAYPDELARAHAA